MRIGMVGLGKMGAGMTRRLLRHDHDVVVHDVAPEAMEALADEGAEATGSLADLVSALPTPRAVWVMVPAGEVTRRTIDELAGLLDPGDAVIDGGNSRFTDTLATAERLREHGVALVDAGTSGGIWGLDEGYCLMIGADDEVFARLEPAFAALATQGGYAHVGPVGAGHYVKMVHNGVEYGLMQAYAEGFDLMAESQFDLDLLAVSEVWRHGSVVRSWLLDLACRALEADADLSELEGVVADSGEGRWTVQDAVGRGVPTPAIAAALYARFDSQRDNPFGHRLLAALRHQFGGHAVIQAPEEEESHGG